MTLRILHNGNVHQQNPHWHLWIQLDGAYNGEMIGRRSNFKGIQEFEGRLADGDAAALFSAAQDMRSEFVARQLQPDDVMVEIAQEGEKFWYAIPPERQASPVPAPFFIIVNQILEPYA